MKLGSTLVICSRVAERLVQSFFIWQSFGLAPEDVGGDAPHPQGGQLDRLAGQVDLAELRLADAVLACGVGPAGRRGGPSAL